MSVSWRVLDTLVRGLEGLFTDMKHKTLIDQSGDPAVEGGFVHPDSHSWPELNARSQSGSARTQAQDHSPHPTHAKMSRHSHDRETREQSLSTTIATRVSHDPEDDHDMGIRVAFAPRHPQITHTRTHVQQVARCAHVHITGGADGYGQGHLGEDRPQAPRRILWR